MRLKLSSEFDPNWFGKNLTDWFVIYCGPVFRPPREPVTIP